MRKRRVHVKKAGRKDADIERYRELTGEERLKLMDKLWDDFWRINGKNEQGLRRVIRRIK